MSTKEEKYMAIDEYLHRAIMTARIMVEDFDCTKDEMQNYLVEKCNEEFHKIFDASSEAFTLMALKELIGMMSNQEFVDLVEEMNK